MLAILVVAPRLFGHRQAINELGLVVVLGYVLSHRKAEGVGVLLLSVVTAVALGAAILIAWLFATSL
jgi:hypothetical protein